MNDDNAVKALNDLNIAIGDAEKSVGAGDGLIDQKALDYLDGVLHKNLIFRRASGVEVGKDQFLKDLEKRNVTYDFSESQVMQVNVHEGKSKGQTTLDQGVATVEVLVQAKGKKKSADNTESWQGIYRNTRIFLKEGNNWQLAFWFNTQVGDLAEASK